MTEPREILEAGVQAGLHLGAQLYVNLRGEIMMDFACGEARKGVPMRSDSVVQWFSAGKPLTALAVAQLYEKGLVRIEAPVSDYIPEFGRQGKEAITIEHLLTHTGGFRKADNFPGDLSWEEMIERICEAPMEENWVAGERAGYSTTGAWFILGEIVRRVSGVKVDEYVRAEILEPVGMNDTWLRLPFEKFKSYGERLALMHDTAAVKREADFMQDAAGMAQCRPGSSARGPIRELGKFYEMLLNGGKAGGKQIVREETIRLITQRHRVGMFDETFLHKMDFGYGFIVNSNRYGAPGSEGVPYGYGRYASDATFGHSGAQSSCAFADPKHGLVVAWVTNGTPGERPHQKRHREINNAVYERLKLNGSA
jgi:CubicO group peptidase (beta-lactamase class C family)